MVRAITLLHHKRLRDKQGRLMIRTHALGPPHPRRTDHHEHGRGRRAGEIAELRSLDDLSVASLPHASDRVFVDHRSSLRPCHFLTASLLTPQLGEDAFGSRGAYDFTSHQPAFRRCHEMRVAVEYARFRSSSIREEGRPSTLHRTAR
jgi:hypothetical protein